MTGPLRSARAALACVFATALLGLGADASPAGAQLIAQASLTRRVELTYEQGHLSTPGYDQVEVQVDYRFYACRGAGAPAIMVSWSFVPANTWFGAHYYYEGQQFAVGHDMPSELRSTRLIGEVRSPLHGTIGEIDRVADPARIYADCVSGGVQYHPVADLADYVDPRDPGAVADFLDGLWIDADVIPGTLRDRNLESRFARDLAANAYAGDPSDGGEDASSGSGSGEGSTGAAGATGAGAAAGTGATTGAAAGTKDGELTPEQMEAIEAGVEAAAVIGGAVLEVASEVDEYMSSEYGGFMVGADYQAAPIGGAVGWTLGIAARDMLPVTLLAGMALGVGAEDDDTENSIMTTFMLGSSIPKLDLVLDPTVPLIGGLWSPFVGLRGIGTNDLDASMIYAPMGGLIRHGEDGFFRLDATLFHGEASFGAAVGWIFGGWNNGLGL